MDIAQKIQETLAEIRRREQEEEMRAREMEFAIVAGKLRDWFGIGEEEIECFTLDPTRVCLRGGIVLAPDYDRGQIEYFSLVAEIDGNERLFGYFYDWEGLARAWEDMNEYLQNRSQKKPEDYHPICPLLSISEESYLHCLKDGCALYIGQCALVTIALK